MGWACSMHGTDEKRIYNFDRKTRREQTTWKGLGIDGRISEWIL